MPADNPAKAVEIYKLARAVGILYSLHDLPDSLITSCEFLFQGRSRREAGKQAQPKTVAKIAIHQQGLKLTRIEINGLRQNRNSQEISAEADFFCAKLSRSRD